MLGPTTQSKIPKPIACAEADRRVLAALAGVRDAEDAQNAEQKGRRSGAYAIPQNLL